MFLKICVVVVVATCVAAQHHHASSYASVNNYVGSHSGGSYGGYHGGDGGGHVIAVPIQAHGGQEGGHGGHEDLYSHHNPNFQYKYGVEDRHTGDYKSHNEERNGDTVKGEYSLLQPDGKIRTVHYSADKHGGFHAQVSYSGHH